MMNFDKALDTYKSIVQKYFEEHGIEIEIDMEEEGLNKVLVIKIKADDENVLENIKNIIKRALGLIFGEN